MLDRMSLDVKGELKREQRRRKHKLRKERQMEARRVRGSGATVFNTPWNPLYELLAA
jgi:ribosomal protein L35